MKEPVSWLYASILAQALSGWSVLNYRTALNAQTGYWPELGTIHQACALLHVIDKPLYLCFVYLTSAYDKVQWPLKQRLGVHSGMLGGIQSLEDGCLLSTRVGGACEHCHSLSIGLSQDAHSVPLCLTSSLMICMTIFKLHAAWTLGSCSCQIGIC